MTTFSRIDGSALYLADSNAASGGWGFAITAEPAPGTDLPATLSLSQALADSGGSFVYVAAGPFPGTDGDPTTFVCQLRTFVKAAAGSQLSTIVFLPDGEAKRLDADTLETYMLLRRSSGKITLGGPGLTIGLTSGPGLNVQIDPNATLSVNSSEDAIELDLGRPVATLGGTFAPSTKAPPSNTARLHFAGPASGAFTFPLIVAQSSLYCDTNWGFQYLLPSSSSARLADAASPLDYVAAWLPLADAGSPGTAIALTAQVSEVNPRNAIPNTTRTVLLFDDSTIKLVSYYRTTYGNKILLSPVVDGDDPAGLVVNDGYKVTPTQHGLRLAPVGEFVMALDDGAPGAAHKVLCGTSGTESIGFLPDIPGSQDGTRLRFVANKPADVPQFPLQAASPIGPPVEPGAALLDDRFQTSWASMVPPPSDPNRLAHYTAAPKGAELFGTESGAGVETGLLGPRDPGVGLRDTVVFPMLPLAGFQAGDGIQDVSAAQLEQVAREIVGPTRKAAIDAGDTITSSSAAASLFPTVARAASSSDQLLSTTTPTGFVSRYGEADGRWKQLLLGQVATGTGSHVTRQLGFTGLTGELQSAFQTSDQFLVIANSEQLGPFVPGSASDPPPSWFMPPADPPVVTTPGFYNTVDIGDWTFACDTGVGNVYGDYRSVMIVKGIKGPILAVDPTTGEATDESLVRSPDKWTMRDVFAVPDAGDTSGLGALSNWLVDYCLAAYDKRDDPYFGHFAQIITDPNWTGVLILKATIADVPSQLAGILAGVKDPADFYVHHVGVEIGQIDGSTVQQVGTSSMFGLISYADPRYDDSAGPHSIAPADLAAPYDFTLLTLKVLFENSAVSKFDSLAQVVLNRLFGSAVTAMVDVVEAVARPNPYNAILLEGSVQRNGDAVVYSLASQLPNRYSLANNVLASVEIDTATMSTRDDGASSGRLVSWIGLTGFMNFAVIPPVKAKTPDGDLPAFDIFSFGPDAGDTKTLRKGLNFDNLGLQVSMPVGDPAQHQAQPAALELIEREIAFTTSASHPRQASIYTDFRLELLGLVSGDANPADGSDKRDPGSLGYLPAVTRYNLRGVDAGAGRWHGLTFKLDLGTPGALAGKVNLDSSLLVAWADDSGAAEGDTDVAAFVGLQLPGAGAGGGLFSLQTVMKLSIGLIQLMYYDPVVAGADGAQGGGGFLLVLNEVALKLLGLLKIPPSGNTAFMLFGNPVATDPTGLGWFALYKKAEKKSAGRAAGLPATTGS